MRAVAAGLSDVGLQREHNEDSFVVLKEYDLFVVADGMGGHRAGDVASKIATETITEFFRTTANEDVTWPFHFDTNLCEEENRLLTGIRVANRQIFERSTRSREYHGMGTTVVGAMFSPQEAPHVHRPRGRLALLPRPQRADSSCSPATIRSSTTTCSPCPTSRTSRGASCRRTSSPARSACRTRSSSICSTTTLPSATSTSSAPTGCRAWCSDDEIRGIVGANSDIRDACRKLIQRANERGGEDNITAVLIKIEEIDEPKIDTGPANSSRGAGPTDPAPPATPDKTGT